MTGFSADQKKLLEAKLNAANVKSRSQAGRNLSYVEGWFVIAEANRIFGHDGWTRETVALDCVWTGEVNGKPACTYSARVRVTAGGVAREGTGAGHGVAKGMGDAHESAIKEAETDATKRALMTFGWPFGLALYDKDQEHVDNGEPPPAPPAPAIKTSHGYHLVNPHDPKGMKKFDRASEFLAELEHQMARGNTADWWAINGSVAKNIASAFPQAAKRVAALENMAAGGLLAAG